MGRTTAVRRLLKGPELEGKPPDDLCFVNNFQEEDRPRLLVFPAGKGGALRRSMEGLIEGLKRNLPQVFESAAFRDQRKRIIEIGRASCRERV